MDWFFALTQWRGPEWIGLDGTGSERIGSLTAHNGGERKRRDRTGVDRNGLDWFFAHSQRMGWDWRGQVRKGLERSGLVL